MGAAPKRSSGVAGAVFVALLLCLCAWSCSARSLDGGTARELLTDAAPATKQTDHKAGSTPVKAGSTPSKTGATPVKAGSTPFKAGSTPVKGSSSSSTAAKKPASSTTKPATQVKPATPVKAATPVKPATPVKAATPVKPATPVKAATPVKPAADVKAAAAPATTPAAPAPAPAAAAKPASSTNALLALLQGLGKLVDSLPKKSATSTPVPKGPSPPPRPPSPSPPPSPPPRPPSPPPTPPPPPSPPPPPPGSTIMEEWITNKTCNSTMLPNGDFEQNEHWDYKIKDWVKIKERGAQGGGIIGNGSDPGSSGWPSYPFDNKNNYFKTQAFGNVAFALVNSYAFEVNNSRQILYFDWYMDNGFDYWLVPDTMSIHANNSNVTLHAARVDIYDYDKLSPPGNLTELATYLFDQWNATAGPAYLGPALTVEDIVQFGNLQTVGSYVPLTPYVGKRILIVFRYSSTVYYLTWGIDNVSVVECDDSLGFYSSRRHRLRRRLA